MITVNRSSCVWGVACLLVTLWAWPWTGRGKFGESRGAGNVRLPAVRFLRMAPIRIRHIVSFSSQDPKHPVENLLIDSFLQPWLSCPRERSRQLRVELQLERAGRIGYIDIGNSGSAFLQIDVGRSIWPLDKGFTTLLPTTTMMSPADSRAMKNHTGVRMFKEGDFLEEAAKEQWDRLRVTCSQPFNKQEQFGLSFIRIRSPVTEEEELRRVAPQDDRPALSPLRPGEESAAAMEKPQGRSHIEVKPQKTSPPRPACLSRSARMLQLSAAKSRKRSRPIPAPPSPPIPPHGGDNDSPMSSGSCPETLTARLHPSQKDHGSPSGRRRLRMVEARRRRRAQTPNSERHLAPRRERDSPRTAPRSPETATNICPICAGHFPAALLPLHAATCGEAPGPHIVLSSSSDDDCDDFWQRPAGRSSPHRLLGRLPAVRFPFSGQRDRRTRQHLRRVVLHYT